MSRKRRNYHHWTCDPNLLRGQVRVTLYKSNLAPAKTYGLIDRRTLSVPDIINRLQDSNTGVTPGMMLHCARIFREEILTLLSEGYSINLFDTGILYPAVKSGTNMTVQKSNCIEARFTVSQEAQDAAQRIRIAEVDNSDVHPRISSVESAPRSNTDGVLLRNRIVIVRGSRLKQGTDSSGIYFVPETEQKIPSADEDSWLRVPGYTVIENYPKSLRFYIPSGTETGKRYYIRVASDVSLKGTIQKKVNAGMSSSPVIIKEE
jgi:hypothetical protein